MTCSQSHLSWFQLPTVNSDAEAEDDPASEYTQKVSSSLTLGRNVYIIHLISSPVHFIITMLPSW